MELLIDIAVYGIGVAILVVAVLFLVGMFSGLIFFARACIDERRLQRSDHRAQIEPHAFAFESAERMHNRSTLVSNGANEIARDMAVQRVIYPSRTFEKDTDRFIDRGIPFLVTVAAGSRKRAAVERELPSMVYFHPRHDSLWRGLRDKLRTAQLWACVASAILDHQYAVTYDLAPDITIRFEPRSG